MMNMDNYMDCFRFLHLLRSFMTWIGLLPMKKSLRALQTSVVFIIVATIPLMKLWNAEQSVLNSDSDSELSRIVNVSSLLLMWIVHIIVLLETSYKIEKFENLILQFEKVEKSLSFECNFEGRSSQTLNWRKIRVYSFLCLELIELILLSWILHLDGISMIRWLFLLYSHITLKVKLFEFVCFVFLTNAMQHDLRSAAARIIEDTVTSIGQIRNEIWMAVKMLEDFCEYSLVGVLLRMYCDITFTSYWAYRCFESGNTIGYKIVNLLFLLVRGLILLACCWICTSCEILECKLITKLLLDSPNKPNSHLNAIIKDLSLELLHKRIEFSAADIIVINVQSLGEMLFSAMLFVVILIQFQMEGFSN